MPSSDIRPQGNVHIDTVKAMAKIETFFKLCRYFLIDHTLWGLYRDQYHPNGKNVT
jgi:hypothetical protein